MFEAPKMLYGPRGWADLDDYRIARNEAEEAAAARDGYFRAGEEAREDLVAAGCWPPGHTDLMISPEAIDAFLEDNPPPNGGDFPVTPLPKRRGRPPKTERR